MRINKEFEEFYDGIAHLLDGAISLNVIDIGHFGIIPVTKCAAKWISEVGSSDIEKKKFFKKLVEDLGNGDSAFTVVPFSIVSDSVSDVLGDDPVDISEEFELVLEEKAGKSMDIYDEDYESYLNGEKKSNEIRYCLIDNNEASFFLNALDYKSGETYFKVMFYMRKANKSYVDMKDFMKMIVDMVASFLGESIVVETNIL